MGIEINENTILNDVAIKEEKLARIEAAKEYSEKMEQEYGDEIAKCAENATFFKLIKREGKPIELWRHRQGKPWKIGKQDIENVCVPEIIVENVKSVPAIFGHQKGNVAVLDFASYKFPGGSFMSGSERASQEASLCQSSYLYNVLTKFDDYYDWNRTHLNNGLYRNRAVYVPKVRFFNDGGESVECNVIACAAPNANVIEQYGRIGHDEIVRVMESRIKFILRVASLKRVDTLILGAFGCGMYKNNEKEVARIFKTELESGKYSIKKAVFAIDGSKKKNFLAFQDVLTNEGGE